MGMDQRWEVEGGELVAEVPSFGVSGWVGFRIRMSTKWFLAEVRTRVVVGSIAGSGRVRTCSRMEMLGAML